MSGCLIHSLTCNGQFDRQNYHRAIDRPINASVHRLILDSIHWTKCKYIQSCKIYPFDSSRNHLIRQCFGLTPRFSEAGAHFARASCPGPWWVIPLGLGGALPWALVEHSPGLWRSPSLGPWWDPHLSLGGALAIFISVVFVVFAFLNEFYRCSLYFIIFHCFSCAFHRFL